MNALDFLKGNMRWLSAGALLTLLSSFGQTFFISLFAGEIRAEFGLSHGDWGALYGVGTLASAIVMIWAGVLSDFFRVRGIGAIVIGLLAVACMMMALNQSVWLLPVTIFALRFLGQGMMSHVVQVALARWFVAARARALAVASAGFTLGEAVLPLTVVALMGVMDWRWIWAGSAVLLVCMIPLLMSLLKVERTPQSIAMDSDETRGMGGRHWRRAEVLRSPLFWMVLPSFMGPPAFGTAFFFQQVHLSEIKLWSHTEFVALIPVYTVTTLVSMMVSGWAIDKWGSWRFLPLYQLPFALGFCVLAVNDSLSGLFMYFVLAGIMHGTMSSLPAAFWAETFGTAHLGAIKSLAMALMVFASAIGPWLSGALIDAGFNFDEQGFGIAAYLVLAAAVAAVGLLVARKRYGAVGASPAA